MASHDRFVNEYEALAERLRGGSDSEARDAIQRLIHETNQRMSSTEVDLFTLEVIDPDWAARDPERAQSLMRQLESEATTAGELPGT